MKTFCIESYNPIHKSLIDGLIQNKITHLMTTNYDLCFDKLIKQNSSSNIQKIVTEKDTDNFADKIYFKIHGSADDHSGDSVVFTLRHESLMPGWKRNLLNRLLRNKNLLVVGYSGLDFEVCPEILRIPTKNIFWNNINDEFPGPNAALVVNNKNGTLLVGDMVDLISDLIYPISPQKAPAINNFVEEIKNLFAKNELNIWRLTLLNSMGCPSIVLKIIDSIDKNSYTLSEQVLIERQKAQSLFHAGKYRSAAKSFVKSALMTEDNSIRVESYLDACDACRCYGAFFSAFGNLKKAFEATKLVYDKKDKIRKLGKIHLKRVLILRSFYQLSAFSKNLQARIRTICQRDLKIASKFSLQTGNWFEFQQIRWWAERLDIDGNVLADEEHYEAPPPKSGYDQMGYHIAQSGVFRDLLHKSKGKLSESARDALSKHIENCRQFGNFPEMWKLLFFKLKLERKNIILTFSQFLFYFFKCQYRPLYRLFQLISGG